MDFFKEFQKLRDKAPRLALRVTHCENAEFTNYSHENRNCYLIFGAAKCEDCYYGVTVIDCRDCVDVHTVHGCELCYECVDCEYCYNSNFLQDCKNVRDSWLCFDCIGCKNCFGCVSQRNKKYMIFNQQLSKEEYGKKLKTHLTLDGLKKAKELFEDLSRRMPRVFSRQINCENVTGDYLVNAKNCIACYDAKEVEDGMYLDRPIIAKDCVDCSNLYDHCELDYMVMSAIRSVNCNFCFLIDFCHDCEYCINCFNSHHLFGCVSRNHAEYEILNEKYSPDAWFKKMREIKEQMKKDGAYGKMFDSDFPYEDSIVTEYLKS